MSVWCFKPGCGRICEFECTEGKRLCPVHFSKHADRHKCQLQSVKSEVVSALEKYSKDMKYFDSSINYALKLTSKLISEIKQTTTQLATELQFRKNDLKKYLLNSKNIDKQTEDSSALLEKIQQKYGQIALIVKYLMTDEELVVLNSRDHQSIEELRKKADNYLNKLNDFKEKEKTLNIEIKKLNSVNQKQKNEIRNLKEEHRKESELFHSSKEKEIKKEKDRLEDMFNICKNENEKLKKEQLSTMESLKKAQSDFSKMDGKYKETKAKLKELKERKCEDCKITNKKLKEFNELNETLQKKNQALTDKITCLKREVIVLQFSIDNLKAGLLQKTPDFQQQKRSEAIGKRSGSAIKTPIPLDILDEPPAKLDKRSDFNSRCKTPAFSTDSEKSPKDSPSGKHKLNQSFTNFNACIKNTKMPLSPKAQSQLIDTVLCGKNLEISEKIIRVLKTTDRKFFVLEGTNPYEDKPQKINFNAKISSVFAHAYALTMLEKYLLPNFKVLDIGSGSGYLTLCFAKMIRTGAVYGVDHIEELNKQAKINIRKAMPDDLINQVQIQIVPGDGRLGLSQFALFNVIHIGAGVSAIPQTLIDQLAPGGVIYAPVGNKKQAIHILEKEGDNRWVTTTRTINLKYSLLKDKAEQLSKSKNI